MSGIAPIGNRTVAYIAGMLTAYQRQTGRKVEHDWCLVFRDDVWLEIVKGLSDSQLVMYVTICPLSLLGIPVKTTKEPIEIVEGQPEDIGSRILIIPPEQVKRIFQELDE